MSADDEARRLLAEQFGDVAAATRERIGPRPPLRPTPEQEQEQRRRDLADALRPDPGETP